MRISQLMLSQSIARFVKLVFSGTQTDLNNFEFPIIPVAPAHENTTL
jgi:hypothetical protein